MPIRSRSLFQRRHFQALAVALNGLLSPQAVENLCCFFSADNPRFYAPSFRRAIGSCASSPAVPPAVPPAVRGKVPVVRVDELII